MGCATIGSMVRLRIKVVLPLFSLFALIVLASCDTLGLTEEKVAGTPIANLEATLEAAKIPIVSESACLLDQKEATLVERVQLGTIRYQGDMLAWSPDNSTLAYVGPATSRSRFYTGSLILLSGKDFKDQYVLPDVEVFGDITWSPDGENIAFIALRATEKIYTVMTFQVSDQKVTDWFPGDLARIDEYASTKGILRWDDAQNLVVAVSCGINCVQNMSIDITATDQRRSLDQVRKNLDTSLNIQITTGEYDTKAYPKMNDPHWSADLQKILYFDNDDRAWVILLESREQFMLTDVAYLDTFEVKWSSDAAFLAIRVDERLFIYQIPC